MDNPPTKARAAAVLLAAGSSTRMSAGLEGGARKPFLRLDGRSVVAHARAAFESAETVCEIVLVTRPEDRELIEAAAPGVKPTVFVAGGAERTDSVRAGVGAVTDGVDVVLVHDVARPLVRPARIDEVTRAAAENGAALLAVPVRDTIKEAEDGRAYRTLDRARLWAAHTPQAFRLAEFRAVLERAADDGVGATDDAALWERYVGPLQLVEDDPENIKLTTPGDLIVAEAIVRSRREEAGE